MGIQNPQTVALGLPKDPSTKVLRSDYAQIPTQYQLASGRYAPTRKTLTLLYPRPDAETATDEYHRIAQTGQSLSIKIKCAFGAYPYAAKIVSAPAGSTIGEWLTPDSYGDLRPSAAYLKITIPALSAGNYQVVVRVFDQAGDSVTANWTLNVGNNYYYCAPTAQGLGDGSSRANAASWATAYGANDAAVSPALGKVLELAGGQYTFTSSVDLNSNKPRSIVNQDDAQPEFITSTDGARFALKRDGQHMRGIRIRGITNGPAIETVGYFSRQSIDQIEFFECSGNPSAANNEAGWFIWSTNNANKRPYFWADEITYTNCNEIAGFDWYSVGPCAVDRLSWNTNLAMLMEPIAFPKASCDIHIRHLTFDNTAIDFDSNGSVLLIGNNEQYSSASCQVSFCFVRTKQDANLNSVIYNASINASSLENWDDHNTYIGGKVTAKNYDADDMVNFNSTIIVNALGGVGMPEGGGATIANCLTGTSGIVDANGRITNSNRGIIGHQIFAG